MGQILIFGREIQFRYWARFRKRGHLGIEVLLTILKPFVASRDVVTIVVNPWCEHVARSPIF
jgi:hypothetical protein